MYKIYVKDGGVKTKSLWGYRILTALLLTMVIFSTYIAVRNSRPVCEDLRSIKTGMETQRLECVYNLGDIQEDEADVLIIKKTSDYIR